MKKSSSALIACLTLAAVLAGSRAFAGQKWGPSLVYLSENTAQGNLTDVRTSADATQYIGCQVSASPGSSFVFCAARNAAGLAKGCSSSLPELVAVANAVEPGTYLYFSWDNTGACNYIQASHYSGFTF